MHLRGMCRGERDLHGGIVCLCGCYQGHQSTINMTSFFIVAIRPKMGDNFILLRYGGDRVGDVAGCTAVCGLYGI